MLQARQSAGEGAPLATHNSSAFDTSGLWLRRRSDAHKRLKLLATISVLTLEIARLPGIAAAGPLAFLGLTDLVVALGKLMRTRLAGEIG